MKAFKGAADLSHAIDALADGKALLFKGLMKADAGKIFHDQVDDLDELPGFDDPGYITVVQRRYGVNLNPETDKVLYAIGYDVVFKKTYYERLALGRGVICQVQVADGVFPYLLVHKIFVLNDFSANVH